MKVAILAGGFGSRLSEETTLRPKPMVEIGGKPIIWHIMKIYASYGLTDFVVLGGYKVDYIRNYFLRYLELNSDFTVDLETGAVEYIRRGAENWRVTVVDTGINSLTGGRIRRARHLLDGETFCLTYGDGVADVDIGKLIEHHKRTDCWATLTAVTQPGRFGALRIDADNSHVLGFREKGPADGGLINGGFFVCEPQIFDFLDGDLSVWEQEPMARLVEQDKLSAYWHPGYWQSMDSLRDKEVLEEAWATNPPWKVWKD